MEKNNLEKPNEQLVKFIETIDTSEHDKQVLINSFSEFVGTAIEWQMKAKDIIVTDESQVELIKESGIARKAIKQIRVAVEHRRKDLKEESLKAGRNIDAVAKFLTSIIEPTEAHLTKQEKFIEDKIAERKEKLKNERFMQLQKVDCDGTYYDLANMPEDAYNNLLENSTIAHNTKIEQEQKAKAEAEEKRIAEEKAEAQRKEQEEKEKRELEEKNAELEKELAEQKRLEAEMNALKEKRTKELQPYSAFIDWSMDLFGIPEQAYQDWFATIKEKAQHHLAEEQKKKAEQEKVAREKQEAEEKLAKLEKEKAEEEERVRLEKEAELKKGDSEKYESLIEDLRNLQSKYIFRSESYKKLQASINDLLEKTITYANSKK